jgi:glycosyltransferase involved in cell wall biosynthesis
MPHVQEPDPAFAGRRSVLHLLGTARAEGAGIAHMVSALAKGLGRERFDIHAWFLGGDGPLAHDVSASGARVEIRDWSRGWRDPVGAWKFWRALHRRRFDIIHSHLGGRGVRRLSRLATGAKLVVHVHGGTSEIPGWSSAQFALYDVDAAIATSLAAARTIAGVKPTVVYPGVPIPRRPGTGERADDAARGNVIGVAGRLIRLKGIVYLIRALSLIRAEFPAVQLEIAGDGPERGSLEREAASLGLAGRVKFLGWQSEMAPILARWAVYAQPSVEEGFGISVAEAMAAGLPVVATSVGGLPEAVEDGKTGWLVPPRDSGALAERLACLLRDSDQRRAFGARGRERASELFSDTRMVSEISKIYEALLANPEEAAPAIHGEDL